MTIRLSTISITSLTESAIPTVVYMPSGAIPLGVMSLVLGNALYYIGDDANMMDPWRLFGSAVPGAVPATVVAEHMYEPQISGAFIGIVRRLLGTDLAVYALRGD